jgi:gas vesicle protein
MIKTFEQFINENYNEMITIKYDDVYGSPIFNEISESLLSNIYNSINEGKLVLDTDMLEEGLFDSVTNLFKKGADKVSDKLKATEKERESDIRSNAGRMLGTGKVEFGDFGAVANGLKKQTEEAIYKKMIDLCDSAAEICEKLAEKENEMYKTISEKMSAINEAVKDFMDKTIEKINDIVVASKNKVSDVISTVMLFCSKMMEVAKEALKTIGKGVVFAFALPFLFAFAVYKGALKVCEKLVEKVKDGSKVVKESFDKIKTAITTWVSDSLNKAKDFLLEACGKIKNGAKSAVNAIGKAYLAIVAILGQLASDTKDAISNAYNKFIESAKEFTDDVKAYISEKWDVVSKWCKKTATAFAEGVKNIWNKITDKVISITGAVKDAYQTLKDNAKATWEEIQDWDDERKKEMFRAQLKYGVDEWGKDTVSDWLAAIQ